MNKNETVLVTGGTGFLASHCIMKLMEKGYEVKTTVRSKKSEEQIRKMLNNEGIASSGRLTVVEADLTADQGWDEAMTGCRYVLHVASPVISADQPESEEEMIRPAVDGTLRVLAASEKAGVKRVVMTSTFGAMGFSNKNKKSITDETCFTDPSEPGLSVYEKSKTLAEQAAWKFVSTGGGKPELAVINPVAILGPSAKPVTTGLSVVARQMIDGVMKAVPEVRVNIIDVRDVADLHVRAMESPEAAGERFLAASGKTMSFLEMAKFLKKEMPDVSAKVSTRKLPGWLIRFAALFNHRAQEGVFLMNVNQNVSIKKAEKILGWKPAVMPQDSLKATVESLIKA